MQGLLLAISFLTIIPAHMSKTEDDRVFRHSLMYFSLVGFVIGTVLMLSAQFLLRVPHPLMIAALVLAIWAAFTRALHMDGLMDSFDGLLSGKERSRKLEIMKDSRVGAMGAVALVMLAVIKLASLEALIGSQTLWPILCAPAYGRAFMLWPMYIYPYARSEEGLGRVFQVQAKLTYIVIAWLILAGGVYFFAGVSGLLITAVCTGIMIVIAHGISKQLGGHTGDTYGACCEMAECLFMLAAVMYPVLL